MKEEEEEEESDDSSDSNERRGCSSSMYHFNSVLQPSTGQQNCLTSGLFRVNVRRGQVMTGLLSHVTRLMDECFSK